MPDSDAEYNSRQAIEETIENALCVCHARAEQAALFQELVARSREAIARSRALIQRVNRQLR